MQTEFTLYRNSQAPLDGTISGANWAYPGSALTANTTQFYAPMKLRHARWVVAWNPDTWSSPTGIALFAADSGPANEQQIVAFQVRHHRTPRVDAADITAFLTGLTEQKTLAHKTFGNGQNGCKIYGSWIEVVWD